MLAVSEQPWKGTQLIRERIQSSTVESQICKHLQIIAARENFFNELHVIELHGKPKSLRVLIELAEQL